MRRHFGETPNHRWTWSLRPRPRTSPRDTAGLSSYSPTVLVGVERLIGTRLRLIVYFNNINYSLLANSQLCTHLASSGKVVLAIEHRDGTSPICRPRSEQTGERYSRPYINPREVV